eukprot:CAMPEP_0181307498 /NCGR_PEP_ID=MMETSP1101-20121128/10916_1 /TAXON_ID=46948 /ORGANISM="Rhodomonas abbreviata, Strain Caron Lab Isolate" /LENGTH=502 /DNA_ID=CAMNT_0023413727 /DNA_START=178 /DNA_END=1683 /DNA_ORIENTATION=-
MKQSIPLLIIFVSVPAACAVSPITRFCSAHKSLQASRSTRLYLAHLRGGAPTLAGHNSHREKSQSEVCQAAGPTFHMSIFDAPYLEQHYGIDADDSVWMEIRKGDRLYTPMLKHISCNSKHTLNSFIPKLGSQRTSLIDDLLGDGETTNCVNMLFGVGVAEIEHKVGDTGHTLYAVHQRCGPVVGTECEPDIWQSLVVLCKGKGNRNVLVSFTDKILHEEILIKDNNVGEFFIFRWDVQCSYWSDICSKTARSLDSVVLPEETKTKIINDMSEFLTRDTYAWYTEHGIPYKRSYLFYGPPGAGKTSLLQALAGRYKRSLCVLQPTDPHFTDDKLAAAIKEAPSRSIIVLEDVDALFNQDRSSGNGKLAITFSGLLNALDGICNPAGQIFILTTNFREHLDAALMRNGRIDLHIQFTDAQPEQMERLFLQFYPQAPAALATQFRAKLVSALENAGEKSVSMAALQHFFIVNRRACAEEAAEGRGIMEEMQEREKQEEAKKEGK